MRPSAASRDDTLALIRSHAFRLFGTFGFDGVSVGQLAAATKLSKGALYWHFKGKEALYIDCLRALHGIFDDHVFGPMRRQDEPIARLLTFFHGAGELVQDPRLAEGIAGYWLYSSRTVDAQIRAVQEDFERRNAALMRETLQAAVDRGVLDLRDDMDDMARAMISILEAIVLPLRSQSTDEVHRTLGVLARTLMRAYTNNPELVELFRDV